MKKSSNFIVGIDEAGRGPLAGPVSVGITIINKKHRHHLRGIKDSKKLSKKQRNDWFLKINALSKIKILKWRVVLVSEKIIDKKGIVHAIRSGVQILLKESGVSKNTQILLDGTLHAPKEYRYQKTIIRGDEKIPVISSASIMAKVTRDRYMERISKKYPKYGFEIHKGYGTKSHYRAIKKHGLSKIHRRSFLLDVLKKLTKT